MALDRNWRQSSEVEKGSEGWMGKEDRKLESQHQRTAIHINLSPRPLICFSQPPTLLPLPEPLGTQTSLTRTGEGLKHIHAWGVAVAHTVAGAKGLTPTNLPQPKAMDWALSCHLLPA